MRRSIRRTSRFAAYAASASLVITGTLLAVTPAEAVAHDPVAENLGATWLQGQLVNGLLPGQFGSPDAGLSIDAATSLRAAGGHDAAVTAVADAIQATGTSYIQYAYSEAGHAYASQSANATAKAMAFLQALTPARATIGAINVQTRLEALTATTAPVAGRIGDYSTKDGVATSDDYANTLGQAFAAYALTKAGSSKAADAVAFLIEQQCPGGGFRLAFTADRTAVGQSCTAGSAAETDVTAIALQELNQIPTSVAVTAARSAARAWLISAQKSDGSWGGGVGTAAANANSTGLAAVALGDSPQSEKAAQWLRAHQATYYDTCDKLATQRGAIAYDNAALAGGRKNGITSGSADQWRRATAQALPALAFLPADATPASPALTGPSGYLKAGSRQVLTTSGLGAGDQVCVSGLGAAVQGTATGATLRSTVTLPAGTANRVYTVRDSYGHADTAALRVLGAKRLPIVTSAYRVKKRHFVTAMITGLVPTEWARIYYKGKFVRSGHATATGKFVATFKVGKAKGKRSITGFGLFTDIRRGATTIKVVR